ncbi:agmatine deiminase family protein [Streptacidiphilus sp. N1-3]|uniref:Agmatine deiminase family protein n=1 Tax=Streptacidiphilus alkalitolerans TaxID=3342712 RepID=A0ABV6X2S6_9ACTN
MDRPALSRRRLLRAGATAVPLVALSGLLPALGGSARAATGAAAGSAGPAATAALQLPSETGPHTRTFLAWPALSSIWGRQLAGVRNDVATIAKAVARYEPVVVLARAAQVADAQAACGSGVQVVPVTVDDLWIRDFGPSFVVGPGAIAGVDTNFNGWGNKQNPHNDDAAAAAALCTRYGITRIDAPLVTEGGALETDGQGTLLATVSSIVNKNRNPGQTQAQLEQKLKTTFGLQKVIWLAGVAGQDITDDHVDALARFSAPGHVILDNPGPSTPTSDIWYQVYAQAKQVLGSATDARGRSLTVVELPEPDYSKIRGKGSDFLASYTNFYTAGGAVFLPQYGDKKADAAAVSILGSLFPGSDIVPLNIDTIASGGGGIHCATQSQPVVPAA